MILISQVIEKKGGQVHSIDAGETLHSAAQAMAVFGVSSLLVRSGDVNVGLLSERDVVLSLANSTGDIYNTPVWRAMNEIHDVDIDQNVQQALGLMTSRSTRHLIVRKDGGIVGLVSIGDLVRSHIDEQEAVITSMDHYIRSDLR